MAGTYVLDRSKTGKFKFNLRAANHKVILSSELYESKESATAGIESVRKNGTLDERFQRKTAKDGSAYFVLTATNGQTVGKSEMYSSAGSMEKGIDSVKKHAKSATVSDRTS
jgi:uncharacterized protein